MEGWDFKFCMCVYNEVQQRSSNGHLPILGSFWEKWQKLHISVTIEKAFGKNLAPKWYKASEKALMPTIKLITVVWWSI